jgi:hypothetical protein
VEALTVREIQQASGGLSRRSPRYAIGSAQPG